VPANSAESDSKGRYIMEALSPFHLLVILAVFVLFFGGKKIPEVMKGLGEGIRNFKEGMNAPSPGPVQSTQAQPPAAPPSTPAIEEKK
jgi:sec-independent protein translocase protein TatA